MAGLVSVHAAVPTFAFSVTVGLVSVPAPVVTATMFEYADEPRRFRAFTR
jgi:hypothetical protein